MSPVTAPRPFRIPVTRFVGTASLRGAYPDFLHLLDQLFPRMYRGHGHSITPGTANDLPLLSECISETDPSNKDADSPPPNGSGPAWLPAAHPLHPRRPRASHTA